MRLGIDLGTCSAKALLLETDGTAIGEASSSYPVHAPYPGWAESEPGDWWLAVGEAVRKAVGDRADRVQAIALEGAIASLSSPYRNSKASGRRHSQALLKTRTFLSNPLKIASLR